MTLPTRILGRTGLEVSVLGYGALELRGEDAGRPIEDREVAQILNAVLDSGINFIDTSIDYGNSEEEIGEAIAHRRSEFFLASKCGCLVGAPSSGDEVGPHVYTKENIVAGVEQSLRRLRTDYLDVLQLHANPSVETIEADDVVETLHTLQQQGKTRFIGVSSSIPHLAGHIAMGAFDVFQIPYTAVQREHEDLITEAAAAGAGTIIRGGVARGARGTTRARSQLWDAYENAKLEELADGADSMTFLLRFTISHPDLSTAIVGTKNPDHLAANLAALSAGPLPSDVHEEAKRRLTAIGVAPKA